MNWTLEVVVVPVSDVDRAKGFYAEASTWITTPEPAMGRVSSS
jgi:predicted enzyme related to lactoylglutathione lyase